MPRRADLASVMLIGSGPIVIGQACEFDYSGTQACKVLKEEGYKVILVNSNPATIMTDPSLAHRTYVEPITPEIVAKIVEKERPDAILPTMGGQTGLNVTVKVAEMGVLDEYKVKLIGADYDATRAQRVLGEIQRKAVRVIELECGLAGQNIALLERARRVCKQPEALGQRPAKARLFEQ